MYVYIYIYKTLLCTLSSSIHYKYKFCPSLNTAHLHTVSLLKDIFSYCILLMCSLYNCT